MARGPGKGNTNNPNGRPKGSQNKDKKELRELIKKFLEDNYSLAEKELLKLKGAQFIDRFIQLLEYATPKLNRTDLTNDGDKFDFSIDGATAIDRFNKIFTDFNRTDKPITEVKAN